MPHLTETATWLLGSGVVGMLGFVLGGGWPLKVYRRMSDLALVDRLKPHFPLRVELDAHVQDDREWRERIMQDFAEPTLDLTKAVLQLTGAIADLKVSSGHMKGQIDRINEQLGELVEHSMQRRASDPSPSP
jgi:hypothetical protein